MSRHVHDLLGRDSLDVVVEPWLIEVKSLGDLRHELLTLRTESHVKRRALLTCTWSQRRTVLFLDFCLYVRDVVKQTRVVTNTELCTRLVSGNKRDRIDTSTQRTEWSQCAVDFLFFTILIYGKNIAPFRNEITLKAPPCCHALPALVCCVSNTDRVLFL